jgi:threonine dehydratase
MPTSSSDLPLVRESVIAAAELIKPYIHITPVHTSRTLDNFASTPQTPEDLTNTTWEGQEPAKPRIRLFFKCENYQKIGAFKARGAFHALSRLTPDQRSNGVITHSSGEFKCTGTEPQSE